MLFFLSFLILFIGNILQFSFCIETNIFRSRIFSLGFNQYSRLCLQEPKVFSCTSKKQISNYPGGDNMKKEIRKIRGNLYNSFFMMEDGTIMVSGYSTYSGIADATENIDVPREVEFPFTNPDNSVIEHFFCSYAFCSFCSDNFEECFGFGRNDYCQFAGCEYKRYIFSPKSIYSGTFSSSDTFFPVRISVGSYNHFVFMKDSNDGSLSLYGTGHNEYGILSIGSTKSGGWGWVEMDVDHIKSALTSSSLSFDEEEIKHIFSLFYYNVFIITKHDNRWFFCGKNIYSTCSSYFGESDNTLEFTEIPQNVDCSSEGYLNELIGQDIEDVQCSESTCVALTSNNSQLYSWSRYTEEMLGRNTELVNEIYSPTAVNMDSLETNRSNIEILEVNIQRYFTFVVLKYKNETNRKRIFGFGKNVYFSFLQQSTLCFVEVFQDYEFTDYLSLSKGNYQEDSLFLQDTSLCWGKYSNDSNDCVNGYCSDFDSCTCEEGYGNTYCQEFVCFGYLASDNQTCNGKGKCVGYDKCDCYLEQSEGVSENCTLPICYNLEADDPSVCSGHGKCIGSDMCYCFSSYDGDECERKALFGAFTVISIIGMTGFFIVLLCVCCTSCICFIGFLGVSFIFKYFHSQKRIRYFNQLKNIDLQYSLLDEFTEENNENNRACASFSINYDIFHLDITEIQLLSLIGSGGSQSKVHKVKYKGDIYAFKSFNVSSFNSKKLFEEFQREVSVLGSFRHKNILSFYGACIKSPRIGILMEYCPKGDVKRFLKNYKKETKGKSYPVIEKLRMLKEIASAVYHLHSHDVIHRDLKLENVLVDNLEITKLMDFGLSRGMNDGDHNRSMTKGIGTSVYMSPELIRGEEYDKSIDSYAFGILSFIVLSEKYECYGKEKEGIEFNVANNPFFRPNLSHLKSVLWIKFLIESCWSDDPKRRPSFEEIINFLEKKRKDSSAIIIYYLFVDDSDKDPTMKNINENEAEDFLLKERNFNQLKQLISMNGREEEEYEFFMKKEKDDFLPIKNTEDVKKCVKKDCLIVIKKKKTIKENSENHNHLQEFVFVKKKENKSNTKILELQEEIKRLNELHRKEIGELKEANATLRLNLIKMEKENFNLKNKTTTQKN